MSLVHAVPPRCAPFVPTLLVISATALLVVSQFYVVIPVFDQLAAAWSTDQRTVTWTQTVFGFGYSAGFLLWGWAADRYGVRRTVVLGGSATAVTTLLVAFAPGVGWALALRTLQGVSAATFAPAAFAYLGTRLAPHRRAVALTTLTSSFFAASIVGQVAAQAVGGADRWPWIFHASGAAFAVAALALALVLLPEPSAPDSEAPPPSPLGAMGPLVAKAPVLLLLLAVSTIMSSFVAVYTAVELSGAVVDPDQLLLLRASGLPAMVLVPLLTPLLVRVPPVARGVAALAGSAAATAGIAAAPETPYVLGTLLFVLVVTVGTAAPSMVEAVMVHAVRTPGAGTALYVFTLFLGASLGPQISALVGYDLTATALAASGVLGAGAACAVASHALTRGRRRTGD